MAFAVAPALAAVAGDAGVVWVGGAGDRAGVGENRGGCGEREKRELPRDAKDCMGAYAAMEGDTPARGPGEGERPRATESPKDEEVGSGASPATTRAGDGRAAAEARGRTSSAASTSSSSSSWCSPSDPERSLLTEPRWARKTASSRGELPRPRGFRERPRASPFAASSAS